MDFAHYSSNLTQQYNIVKFILWSYSQAVRLELTQKYSQASTLYYNILCNGLLYAEANKGILHDVLLV